MTAFSYRPVLYVHIKMAHKVDATYHHTQQNMNMFQHTPAGCVYYRRKSGIESLHWHCPR